MSAFTLLPPVPGPAGFGPAVKLWTVDEYHQLIDRGVILDGAPIELIDGMLVYKDRGEGGIAMTYGPKHAYAIAQLVELNGKLRKLGFHMRTQVPLTIRPNHEPEPDGAVIVGEPAAYRDRNPGPSDCCLVIEVADSSLDNDRGVKQRIYATAGIPAYWIVNIRHNTIEVYEQPDAQTHEYRVRRDRLPGETIDFTLPTGAALQVVVSEIVS